MLILNNNFFGTMELSGYALNLTLTQRSGDKLICEINLIYI